MRTKIISVVNQKGGTAKTTTVLNLGIGLANHGYRVLLIDLDPQGSLTVCLGHDFPDELNNTITDLLEGIKDESPISCETVIRKHEEGVDYIPGNITLSGLEVSLVNTMNRERILQQLLQQIANGYDYILIDCMPSLGMLTLNALAASNEVIVPVQANYLSIKGLEQLLYRDILNWLNVLMQAIQEVRLYKREELSASVLLFFLFIFFIIPFDIQS